MVNSKMDRKFNELKETSKAFSISGGSEVLVATNYWCENNSCYALFITPVT